MAVSSPALHEAIADIAGHEHVRSDPVALAAAAVDGIEPRWVVRARTVEVVSRLLALASPERLAVAPRGSGSSLGLGHAPRKLDLVLDLSQLSAIVDYVPEDMVVSVESGVTLGGLAELLSRHRQRLALDPIRGERRTVGGVLATNASGPLRFRYGTARDLLLGVRFVQADGAITWGGSKVVKSVTGYDVPKLLVGSLGTIGVIVGATMRVHPMPASSGCWLCAFTSAARAQDFLAALLASPIEPERVAVVNRVAGALCGWPGSGPAVLIAIGSVEDAVASQAAALSELARRHGGAREPRSASAFSDLGGALEAPLVLKIACEIRRIMAWLARAEELAAAARLDVAAVGQAGNGVLHLAVRGVVSAEALDQTLLAPLREGLAEEGGSAVVERAPATMKAALDVWGPMAPDVLAIMARIKREFDPDGILNPGRFVGGL
jgi:glycolate oxidase FAD binding subunit